MNHRGFVQTTSAILALAIAACSGSSSKSPPSREDCRAAAERHYQLNKDWTSDRLGQERGFADHAPGAEEWAQAMISQIEMRCLDRETGWSHDSVACVRKAESWDQLVYDCGIFSPEQVEEHRRQQADEAREAAAEVDAAPPVPVDSAPPTAFSRLDDGSYLLTLVRHRGGQTPLTVKVEVHPPVDWVADSNTMWVEFRPPGGDILGPNANVRLVLDEPDSAAIDDRARAFIAAALDESKAFTGEGWQTKTLADTTLPNGRYQMVQYSLTPRMGNVVFECLAYRPTDTFAVHIQGRAQVPENEALLASYRAMCETVEIVEPAAPQP